MPRRKRGNQASAARWAVRTGITPWTHGRINPLIRVNGYTRRTFIDRLAADHVLTPRFGGDFFAQHSSKKASWRFMRHLLKSIKPASDNAGWPSDGQSVLDKMRTRRMVDQCAGNHAAISGMTMTCGYWDGWDFYPAGACFYVISCDGSGRLLCPDPRRPSPGNFKAGFLLQFVLIQAEIFADGF